MRKTPIFFVMAFLFACLSCGVPEDDKPGTVSSPLIDRSEIPEGNSGAASCGLPFPVKLTSMSNAGIGNMNGNEPYQFIGRLDNDATNGRIEAIRR